MYIIMIKLKNICIQKNHNHNNDEDLICIYCHMVPWVDVCMWDQRMGHVFEYLEYCTPLGYIEIIWKFNFLKKILTYT